MQLTPLDIKKQDFTGRSFGGYDKDEVKAFLDTMANQWEQVQTDQRRLQDKVKELENKLDHYEKVEEALQEALQTARETTRKAEQQAEKQAELIIREANAEAQSIVYQAEQDRDRLELQVDRLQDRRDEVVARLRAFLTSELELLSHFDQGVSIGAFEPAKLLAHPEEATWTPDEDEVASVPDDAAPPAGAASDVAEPDAATSDVAEPVATQPDAAEQETLEPDEWTPDEDAWMPDEEPVPSVAAVDAAQEGTLAASTPDAPPPEQAREPMGL
ncbi:MAG: DivIVA domain-containing protein, partial [Bacteroidetes bacterium]|nr:DivIVA domain-containing protein [Bacteroidota bacterium]